MPETWPPRPEYPSTTATPRGLETSKKSNVKALRLLIPGMLMLAFSSARLTLPLHTRYGGAAMAAWTKAGQEALALTGAVLVLIGARRTRKPDAPPAGDLALQHGGGKGITPHNGE